MFSVSPDAAGANMVVANGIATVAYVGVTILFYIIFRPVSPSLSALAAVVSAKAREARGPRLALQVMVYPVMNLASRDTPSHREFEGHFLTPSSMDWFTAHYLPRIEDRSNPEASPEFLSNLQGLPPALVITAECDPLRDEGNDYARRLAEAGVPVTHRTFPGQFHGFFTMGKLLQQANVAASDIGAWLKALN